MAPLNNNRRDFLQKASLASLAFIGPGRTAWSQSETAFRRITTEEAFIIPEITAAIHELMATGAADEPGYTTFYNRIIGTPFAGIWDRLADLEGERLDAMDAAGIDMQVLSLTSPGVQAFGAEQATELARLANDRAAEIVEKHPTRFAALATLAPQDIEGAALELERAVGTLGLHGIVINSHTKGEFLDNQKFWPILESAEAAGAPVYLHPRTPPAGMLDPFTEYPLEGATWGFHMESSLHAVRMMLGGVFDQFPNLTVILGHMGEGVPFWLDRLDSTLRRFYQSPNWIAQRMPSEYFLDNFVITTSGMNSPPTLNLCMEVLGADRIMFAVDYPYGINEPLVKMIEDAPLSSSDRAKIFHRTAERVFGI